MKPTRYQWRINVTPKRNEHIIAHAKRWDMTVHEVIAEALQEHRMKHEPKRLREENLDA